MVNGICLLPILTSTTFSLSHWSQGLWTGGHLCLDSGQMSSCSKPELEDKGKLTRGLPPSQVPSFLLFSTVICSSWLHRDHDRRNYDQNQPESSKKWNKNTASPPQSIPTVYLTWIFNLISENISLFGLLLHILLWILLTSTETENNNGKRKEKDLLPSDNLMF